MNRFAKCLDLLHLNKQPELLMSFHLSNREIEHYLIAKNYFIHSTLGRLISKSVVNDKS